MLDNRPASDDLDDRFAQYAHGHGRHARPDQDDYPAHDGYEPQAAHAHHGHSHHAHASHPATPASRQAVRLVSAVLVPVALVAVAALIWLWPGGVTADRQDPAQNPQRYTADVVTVAEQPCPPRPEGAPPGALAGTFRCGSVTIQLTGGPERGKRVDTEIPGGPGAPTLRAGDKVVVLFLADALSGQPYQVIDHQRSMPLLALALAFVFAVVAFGRWRGLRALAGLAVTFSVLLLFIVPAILNGQAPLLTAIVGSAVIMLSVLFLTHGFNLTTAVAVLGTLASLTVTGVLSAVSTWATRLTGVANEEASFLNASFQDVNMQGLLLAGILIGSLGVLDDVCVTQAATVTELTRANPDLTYGQTYQAATRIGRAHIASVINTIILAYAGASLPLLILLAAGDQPVGELLTSQFLAEEIVRSAVGTIGLITAVPITTALAALAARPLSADRDITAAHRR